MKDNHNVKEMMGDIEYWFYDEEMHGDDMEIFMGDARKMVINIEKIRKDIGEMVGDN